MGDLIPEAQVNGLATFNFIALICNKDSAVLREDCSFIRILQMYSVFIYDKTIYFSKNYKQPAENALVQVKNFIPGDIMMADFQEFLDNTSARSMIFTTQNSVHKIFRSFRESFTCINAAGGVVENPQGHFLMIFKYNKWDFPKGKVDTGETIHEAAVREVTEETGIRHPVITGKLPVVYHMYLSEQGWILKKTYWFRMNVSGVNRPIPETQEGIQQARWLAQEDVKDIYDKTYLSLQPIVKILMGNDKSIG